MDNYISECNVCKQRYDNWVGSTPCCGSIAYRLDENYKPTGTFDLYLISPQIKETEK